MDIRRFLAELKGRGVYRVAAFYAAGSWALLQVADIFFPILGFPDWAITTVLAVAALGFPIAIVLSWVFEITPHGIVETDAVGVNFGRLRLSPARFVELGLLVALIGLVSWLYVERLTLQEKASTATAAAGDKPSVAVLAFENLSDDRELEYFGDGLSEEILNLLAKINEINVASRTSSFYFKDKDVGIQEVGRRLGVAHVLEGSVRRSNGRVRVTAQLIEVEGGFHLWSSTYDRNFEDAFLIEDDIAREVVNQLEVLLSPGSRAILDRTVKRNPEAYDYYLQGRNYLRNAPSDKMLEAAVSLFERATSLDEGYAEAYAGLCDARLGQYRLSIDRNDFERAQLACERALELNRQALPVYVALGNLYRHSGEYEDAIAEFEQALNINASSIDALVGLANTLALDNKPRRAEEALAAALEVETFNAHAYLAMANFLFNEGRFEEAIPYYQRTAAFMPDNTRAFNGLGASFYMLNEFDQAAEAWQRALALRPTSVLYSNVGTSLFFSGRFAEAVDVYQKAVELAPDDFQSWGNLGDAYRYTDDRKELAVPMYRNAIKLAMEVLSVNSQDPTTLVLVAHYHAAAGDREEALQYQARANALAPDDLFVSYQSAVLLSTLGEADRAMAALEHAVRMGYSIDLIRVDVGLAPLHGQEAYAQLVAPDNSVLAIQRGKANE